MWDTLKKEIKGWDSLDVEAYLETFGFYVCTRTDTCIYAIDKYGYGEYVYLN